ncbi:replication-associated protein (plasmid) [Staphylococcus xylosus]|nr:replication-associated protein [Staphylococcus xylosus]
MKTIKMVADELNVTKQTIVNNAKNLNVSFEKENGVNYINDDDYLRIIEKITKKENTIENRETVKKEDSNKKSPEVENTVYSNIDSSDTLKTKVNELEKQIEIFETRAKNDEKYIGNLTKQLDQQNSNVNTLNKLLENQQILALESNKKIQKLEHQLEEERQLKYTFDKATNDRQNINAQEAAFTEEDQNMNQQQEEKQPKETKIENNDIPAEKKGDSIKEDEFPKDDKPSEEIESETVDRGEQTSKKGFWSRLFGN